jgi:hypothetical protein
LCLISNVSFPNPSKRSGTNGGWRSREKWLARKLLPIMLRWQDGVLKKLEREIREMQVSGPICLSHHLLSYCLSQRTPTDLFVGLATQLALAYAIHKSFIFIRVPLTAAITPKVVKILRGWGWDIGKRTTKEAKAIKRSLAKPTTK